MTTLTSTTWQRPLSRLPPVRLDALPEVTAALAGRAAEHDRDGSFPAAGISRVHGAGLLTATVAGRYGGAGAGLATTVHILRALGRGDPSVALVTAMTLFTHAMQARARTWPHRIYQELLDESAARPVLINALRVEPDLGTPARGGLPATVASWASGAGGNSTALVGTPDTVARALLDYVDIGVSTLLIRGYDPLEDATDYGRELIPLVRAEVARRDAAQATAGAELAGRP